MELLPNWLESIGTLLAVLVALFYSPLLERFRRPKVEIDFENKPPFIEIKDVETDSSNKNREIRIRIRVKNKGRTTSTHSVLVVDSYFKKREKEDVYIENVFLPKNIRDSKNSLHSFIAPKLSYFFDIAIVQKYDGMTENDSEGKPKQFYKLYLLGDSKAIQLGKGTFVVPINFYGSKIDVVTCYLKIYWDSDDFTKNKSSFGVSILSSKEFKQLKIEK